MKIKELKAISSYFLSTLPFFFKRVEGICAKILYLDYGLTLALRVFRDFRVIRVTITHNAHYI